MEIAFSESGMFVITMAKQAGEVFITGTIDELTFYKMDGTYYVRLKSSLNRKRFMKDAQFERSRKSAERFALGNTLASRLYKMVDAEHKEYKLFCFLKRKAILLFKEEKSVSEVEEILMDYLKDFGLVKDEKEIKTKDDSNTLKLYSPGRSHSFNHKRKTLFDESATHLAKQGRLVGEERLFLTPYRFLFFLKEW